MGYADGYYYGQGRIICDTSTFSVGDTIRVRSVYNALQTEDKQVVTVGTPLIFTVPPYDYYKICRVQTINDTPTEVGGEYVEIGFGDLHRSNVLDKTTLGGIQGILNAHQESTSLSVGDEVNINLNGNDWTMQIAGIDLYDTHEVIFRSKYLPSDSSIVPAYNKYSYRTNVLNYLNNFYTYISNNERSLIKDKTVACSYTASGTEISTHKVWLPTRYEIFGDWSNEAAIGNIQFPIFTTQANRARQTPDGTARDYMTASYTGTSSGYVDGVKSDGTRIGTANALYLLPCFRLTADA